MLFTNISFLYYFLPVLIIIYFIMPKKFKNIILFLASMIFYFYGEPKYILLMILEILIAYIGGILIKKYKNKKMLFGIIIIHIIFLCFFKYTDFIIGNINNIFNANFKLLNLALPIGISFYTFQIISYEIDIYRGKVDVQRNFLKLATYVSLFPQLIAGPIVRYETIENELDNRTHSFEKFSYGVERFVIGLAKKVLIANQLGQLCKVFTETNEKTILFYWIFAVGYMLQIYFDFSAYSDMAIGLGKMFGFDFLENFDYPYISKSITEFWRRWHISLSTWFRDYVYIPLGGNRVNKFKWIRNIILVWLLTGLWHGAAWNFIIWGIYYGLLLLFEKLFFDRILKKLPTIINWLYTFIIVMIGWMIFRSNSLNELLLFIKTMFVYKQTDWLTILADNLSTFNALMFVLPAFILSFPILKKIKEKYSGKTIYIILTNILLLMLFIMCIVYLTSSSYNPFIYFRF